MLISSQNFEFIRINENDNNEKYENNYIENYDDENSNNQKNVYTQCKCKCRYFHQNKLLVNKYHFLTECFVCDLSL